MATVHVQYTDTQATAVVIEVYQRGSNGQPDTLVQSGLHAAGAPVSNVALAADCYVVVRPATEAEAKSVDNW